MIGFEEKYLASNRRGSEDRITGNSKSRDGSLFEGIRSQRGREVDRERSRQLEREKSDGKSKPKIDEPRLREREDRYAGYLSKSPKIERFNYR